MTPTSIGRVKLGMYLNQVADKFGNRNLAETLGRIDGQYCRSIFSKVVDSSRGISFVGIRSSAIDRIDVELTPPDQRGANGAPILADTVRTKEGLRLGDSLQKMRRIYARSPVYAAPEEIAAGYFIVPLRGEATGYALVVDGGTVIEVRAGRMHALKHRGACG